MQDTENVIRRAYAEAALAAREKGLTGAGAVRAVLAAAAKVSSRILGREITPTDVEATVRGV